MAKYVKPAYDTLTDADTHEEIHPDVYISAGNALFSYKISTPYGETRSSIGAYRDPTNNWEQYFRINLRIDYGYSKRIRYLKNNVITVTEDESTWDNAINKILNVITTINKEVANCVKEIVLETMNQFLDRIESIIEQQDD